MKRLLISGILALFSFVLFSQTSLKSIEENYFDFLSLQGLIERPYLNYRTLSDNEWNIPDDLSIEEDVWKNNNLGRKYTLWENEVPLSNFFMDGIKQGVYFKAYGPEWFSSYNTSTPYGQNDGALWQGKGFNTSLTAGIRFEGYGFEATLRPQICWSENREFEILASAYENQYGNFHGYGSGAGYDKPQRFGDQPFWTFDWGDTEIRYTWNNLTLGFGTENIWLGPAYVNPMLHSNNAPTYPKFDMGLRKTKVEIPFWNLDLGFIEGRIWVGQLTESDYFDSDPTNDKRMLSGFNASWSPSFIPGFTLGLNKVCLAHWDINSWKYLNPFYSSNAVGEGKDRGEDQKMSVSIDWLFPSIGFEVWGEGGLDDYSSNKIANPFHTFVWSAGIKQVLPQIKNKDIHFELILEANNLEMSQDFQLQWRYMGYYSHSGISQGYTQKGQIMGNGSTVGGNSQYAELKMIIPKGDVSLFIHRFVPDINYILNKAVRTDASKPSEIWEKYYADYETYLSFGLKGDYFITPSLAISGTAILNFINCPNYRNGEYIATGHFDLVVKYCF